MSPNGMTIQFDRGSVWTRCRSSRCLAPALLRRHGITIGPIVRFLSNG